MTGDRTRAGEKKGPSRRKWYARETRWAHVASESGSPSTVSIAVLQRQLGTLAQRIQQAARRSRRLSWLSVSYIIATTVGVGVAFTVEIWLLISGLTMGPVSPLYYTWPFIVAAIPPVGIAFLAAREVRLGLREAGEPLQPPPNATPVKPEGGTVGWTEAVQQSQQRITHMKAETQFSLVWFFLGTFGLATTEGGVVLSQFASSQTSLGPFAFILVYVLAFAFLLLLIPFYLATRDWIRTYQDLLDWEVNGLTQLESEFFTRFARLAAPT